MQSRAISGEDVKQIELAPDRPSAGFCGDGDEHSGSVQLEIKRTVEKMLNRPIDCSENILVFSRISKR